MTGNQLNVAIVAAPAERLQGRRRQPGRARRGRQHRARAGPARAGEASLDCAFLSFFCSKPKVTLTVSAGPGSAKVPATAGAQPGGSGAEAGRGGLRAAACETVNSEQVEAGLVIHSDPSGGTTATRGSTVVLTVSPGRSWPRCRSWSARSARSPCSRSAAAASRPSVEEEESSAPAGEVIRQSPSAGSELPTGSTVSIVVSKGEEQARGAERDRQANAPKRCEALRDGRPRPDGAANRRPKCRRRSAGSPTSSRRRARKSSPAPR